MESQTDTTQLLHVARLKLQALQISAARIDRNAYLRRTSRRAPSSEAERLRFRRRDYDAVKRAKQTRKQAALVLDWIKDHEQVDLTPPTP